MSKYSIYIGTATFQVFGCEAAYEVFRKACEFAEMLGEEVYLIDDETGAVLDYN